MSEPLAFERLGPEDGLPHNTVNDILQDRQGYLWLATDGGLSRYDGYGFVNHRIEPAGGSNVLMRLLEDSSGDLWVGSETGLWRFDRSSGSFAAAPLDGSTDGGTGYAQALLEDRSGGLWAGIGPALYRRRPGGSNLRRVDVAGEPFERFWSLAQDSGGAIWAVIGDAGGLHPELRRLDVGTGSGNGVRIAERFHVELFIDSKDRFWTGPLDPAAETAPRVETPRLGSYLNDLVELDDDRFWLASAEGLWWYEPATGRRVRHPLAPEAPSWQSEHARSLLVDRTGGLWVGTLAGLFHHDPHLPRFRHWRHDPRDPASLSAGPVSDIVAGPDGHLWIGTFGGGFNRVAPETGRAERFRHDPGDPGSPPDDVVWSLAWDGDGRLWLALNTPTIFDPGSGRFESRALPVAGESPAPGPVSLLVDGARRVWLGTQRRGLFGYHLDERSWQWFEELHANQIVAGAGALWTAGRGALARLDTATGTAEVFALRATDGRLLTDVEVLDLYPQEDAVWLATTAGLGRFGRADRSWVLPLAAAELPGSVVFSIQPDDRGNLWLGTNQGLVRFSPRAPSGRRVRTYDLADGVGNVEFNRHSRYRAPDGTIYMGGMNGITVFHPREVRDNPHVPPIVLTGIRTLGRKGDARLDPRGLARLVLPQETVEVTFSFTALGFTRANRNRYAYKLEGFDRDWSDGGTGRSARYTNIPHGSYVFRVRGSNSDGVWGDREARLAVDVPPAFWQTWWFRLLALAALIATLTLAYRLRIRRLIQLERMRLRIAGDLHDELGSELSGIALATTRLAGRDYLPEGDRRRLDDVRASAIQVMQGLRDVVWFVNPEHDNLTSLEGRMRSAATVLLAAREHRFEADLPDGGAGIDMATRRGLYLIYKELLTNAARHADAEDVRIRLAARDGEVLLEVADGGGGFDSATRTDGSGLASIRRRAAQMKAIFDLDSRPGSGCRARLRVKMTRTRQSRGRGRRPRMGG